MAGVHSSRISTVQHLSNPESYVLGRLLTAERFS
jgi:hypothetical protein